MIVAYYTENHPQTGATMSTEIRDQEPAEPHSANQMNVGRFLVFLFVELLLEPSRNDRIPRQTQARQSTKRHIRDSV